MKIIIGETELRWGEGVYRSPVLSDQFLVKKNCSKNVLK